MNAERARTRLERVRGWPLALGAGTLGFSIWSLQAGSGALEGRAPTPGGDATLWVALGHWLHAAWFSLPMVLAVLFLSLSLGALLSGTVIFGPPAVGMVFRRLHELGGAVPTVLVLMLWRLGASPATSVGFVLIVSAMFAIEIAQMLADTGRRLERAEARPSRGRNWRARWDHFLTTSVYELRTQLTNQAALVASAVFGLDAALAFVGLGLEGAPTWGRILGDHARGWAIAPSLFILSLLGVLGTVVAAYRLIAADRGGARGLDRPRPNPPLD